ncbi:MAG: hypothetical protein A2Y25_11955 [Candidatus Melainabacteria bacterium GWF2_37_15]|nr:MAG: hypothetical protein A2Y25_11955 [Candidatus Melainabacteria bacterium GWF2_37_15]
MKKIKKIIIVFLIFQALLMPQLKAFASIGQNYILEAPTGGGSSGTSLWALIPYGCAVVGSLFYAGLADSGSRNGGLLIMDNWNQIYEFAPQKAIGIEELQTIASSPNLGGILYSSTVLVRSVQAAPNAEEEIFLFPGNNIKNNALHLHHIEIPAELANSKQKLVAETTLIYENPDNEQLDFRLIKNAKIGNFDSISKKKNNAKSTTKEENSTISVVQQEIKINSPQKPYVLAVYMPPGKKDADKEDIISEVKYVALVKIKVQTPENKK